MLFIQKQSLKAKSIDMKVLLVEDEELALEHLERQLLELEPEIEIMGRFDTVSQTVQFLQSNEVDLLFLDIHLADALSFTIFDQVEVKTPVIFTTAYDQYTLKAFKVNSIDYLLKPIDKEELKSAIEQYKSIVEPRQINWQDLQKMMSAQSQQNYQKRFLVNRRDKILTVKIEDVAYFEGEDRYTYLMRKDGKKFIIDYKLNELEDLLDPDQFFRLNRSFIAHLDAIEKIVVVSNSRVKVHLNPPNSRDIVVSTQNTRNFKLWLNR